MSSTCQRLIVGTFALLMIARAEAQVPYYMGAGAAPVFQVNPLLQQAAANQALVNQAVLNQTLYQQAAAQQVAQIPGLPNYLGGSLTSTPLGTMGTPPSYGTSPGYSSSPGYNSSGYPPYTAYYPTPAGDALRGLASLTLAYGQYIQDYEQARLMNQQVARSKIASQHLIIEEWRWRQSLMPKAEDLRRLELERDLARATKQAPFSEILEGKTLNVLLANLKQMHGKGRQGPPIPLDEEILKQINVAPRAGLNVAFIKTGEIAWPLSLRGDAFTKFRDKLNLNLKDAVQQARINGKVDDPLLKDLEATRRSMDDTLDKLATDLTISQYMEAKRYLAYVGDGIRALEGTDVANFFNRKYEARGKTVADLINYMERQGLVFVGAIPGNEGPYRALYSLMLGYYDSMAQLSTR